MLRRIGLLLILVITNLVWPASSGFAQNPPPGAVPWMPGVGGLGGQQKGLVYDAALGSLILFETDATARLNGIRTWDGSAWQQRGAGGSPAPDSLDISEMAYDAARGRVVAFGGSVLSGPSHPTSGTWTWDGSAWARQQPLVSPPSRDSFSLAYDAARQQVVLFGGFCLDGEGTCSFGAPVTNHAFNETWTWDGTTWTQQHPATNPPARTDAHMTYDAAREQIVLFGGDCPSHDPSCSAGQGQQGVPFSDTWVWDGATWTLQVTVASPPHNLAGTAPDEARGTVVALGKDGTTWIWDGRSWTQQHPATSPPSRYNALMAYDGATSQVVLAGGLWAPCAVNGCEGKFYQLHDTWAWDGTTWTSLAQDSP